mgnify:CR=1 FL=1
MIFNSSKKHNELEPDFVDDQAVILEIDLEGMEEFGTPAQHQEIERLEHKIAELLPAKSGLDGDEFGEGICTIYLYGPSAEEIFEAIETVLKSSSFNHIDITLQYGPPEDPDTKDKKFTL